MKSKQARWLENESKLWVSENIISTEQAEKLNARYVSDNSSSTFGVSLFGGFGAAILAAGIIALFAYNWEEMHRYAKLLTLFSIFLASHLAGIFCARKDKLKTLAAVFHLLGTLLFGANMALISQIYHTGGQLYDLLMVWALGTLAVAWATTSVINGIAACGLLTAWACVYMTKACSTLWIAPIILFLSCVPLAWIRKSYVLLALTFMATGILITGNLLSYDIDPSLICILAIAVGLALNAIATVSSKLNTDFNPANLLKHFGYSLILGNLFFFSTSAYRWSFYDDYSPMIPPISIGIMIASTITYLAALRTELKVPYNIITLIVSYLLPIFVVLLLSMELSKLSADSYEYSGYLIHILLINCTLLGIALKWMFHGANTTSMYLMVCGSIALTILAGFRFFDTFDSLLWRGICFVVTGGFIFGIGIYYNRIKKEHGTQTKNNKPALS